MLNVFIESSFEKNSPHPSLGLERKLKTTLDTLEQLSKDKSKLQNDISDMMKESGDSSVQLTKMNEDLTQKERYHTFLHSVIICTISYNRYVNMILSVNFLVQIYTFCLLRRLEELQSQLAEEKDKVALLNEQLQQEKSHNERELQETRESHQSQISGLQEKIVNLVCIVGQ